MAQRTQFNIIQPDSGLKVGVIIPADSPFNQNRLQRRRRLRPYGEVDAWFASPEDVIIKKMEYYREGGSEKHLRNITGMLKVSGNTIDRAYISEWADQLGVRPIWQAVCERLK